MEQNKIFESTAQDNVKKSAFDLTHMKALSMDIGKLVPTFVQEVLPSDEFNIQQENLARFAPQLAPWFGMMDITTHFFFVPNRLLWSEWKDFITGGKDGTSAPSMPTSDLANLMNNADYKELGDYLGLPEVTASGTSTLAVSRLLPSAYQKIWSDYYRDPNLTDELDIQANILTGGTDVWGLRTSAYEKDYFTSALPFLQRGVAVGIPIQLEYKTITDVYQSTGATLGTFESLTAGTSPNYERLKSSVSGNSLRVENLKSLDLDFTINELRTSSALQRFFEKQAVQGYRYTETLRSHFNVTAGDARLQRAEYIGGGKQPLVISEVLSNTQTIDSADQVVNPVGEMAGHGISSGNTISANYKVEEHGFILGITRVLPRTMYYQGVPKHFLRDDKFDYAWPELANLGEQPILNAELYFDRDDDTYNEGTFGYAQRYASYKFQLSSVHGDFRNYLEYWQSARKFGSQQSLNESFVTVDTDNYNRLFAAQTGHKVWMQVLNKTKAIRPLPYFANPQLR